MRAWFGLRKGVNPPEEVGANRHDDADGEWRAITAPTVPVTMAMQPRAHEAAASKADARVAGETNAATRGDADSSLTNVPMVKTRIETALRFAARQAIDLVLPPQCVACGTLVADHGSLCSTCWRDVRWVERPFCEALGAPMAVDLGPGALSPLAIAAPPPFDRARAAVMFDALPRRLVHRLKYSDDTGLARWMAGWMARAATELAAPDDGSARSTIVVPVPLHRTRLVQRRFNQSAELSRHLAVRLKLEHRPDALKRVKPTRQQVGLGHKERQRNVSGAFAVPDACRAFVKGRRVLLVDDVLTTGATVGAATRALKRGGAAHVDVLTFARVDHGDDGMAFAQAAEAFDTMD